MVSVGNYYQLHFLYISVCMPVQFKSRIGQYFSRYYMSLSAIVTFTFTFTLMSLFHFQYSKNYKTIVERLRGQRFCVAKIYICSFSKNLDFGNVNPPFYGKFSMVD